MDNGGVLVYAGGLLVNGVVGHASIGVHLNLAIDGQTGQPCVVDIYVDIFNEGVTMWV